MALAPFLAFAFCALVWGSTWLFIKVGYEDMGALTSGALRFGLAALLFVPVGLVLKARPPQGREWGLAVFVGFVLVGFDYGLIYWGEQWLSSGLTAVLFSTMPLFVAITARAYLGERLTAKRVAGILTGLAGVALLFADSLRDVVSAPLLPMLALLGAAFFAAVSSVATKKHGKDLHPASLMAVASAVGALFLAAWAALRGETLALPTTALAWTSVLYLAAMGTVATFVAYFWLLKRWSATAASLLTILVPLVAVILGTVVLREPVTWTLLAGTALVVGGVVAASLGSARKPPVAQGSRAKA